MRQVGDGRRLGEHERLFLSLAEQLSRPLTAVSRMAELAAEDSTAQPEQWRSVQAIAHASLQLVEHYALSLRLQGTITPLTLEPLTVSSLLYDTAERLAPLARQYGVELELDTGPRALPVQSDRTVLRSAFESLGQVFIAAQAESENREPVRLSAHRGRYGIVAGLYSANGGLSVESLRRAQAVQGQARQPLQQLVSGPAAGVFVADNLLQALSTHLHAAKYHGMTGLAATLHPSRQLQLV